MNHQENTPDPDLFTGRRSFDRQMELLTIAVHTLQRDFAALEERVRGMKETVLTFTDSLTLLEDEVHKLDRALLTRVATITVAERTLWIVITVLMGLGVKFIG